MFVIIYAGVNSVDPTWAHQKCGVDKTHGFENIAFLRSFKF